MPPFERDFTDLRYSLLQHLFDFLYGTCHILVLSFDWLVGVFVVYILP